MRARRTACVSGQSLCGSCDLKQRRPCWGDQYSPLFGPSWPLGGAPLYAKCSVLSRDAFIFCGENGVRFSLKKKKEPFPLHAPRPLLTCVRISRISWKFVVAPASFVWSKVTTFPRCSSAFSVPFPPRCALLNVCRSDSCLLMAAMSCLMMYVSSLISTGRSSKSVFLRATVWGKRRRTTWFSSWSGLRGLWASLH